MKRIKSVEIDLRRMWNEKGVPKERQDELINQISNTTVRFKGRQPTKTDAQPERQPNK